jgi:hypothetical protein
VIVPRSAWLLLALATTVPSLSSGQTTIQFAPAGYGVGSEPRAVAVVDLNLDGKRDLVVANAGSNSLSILLGNGSGTFAPATA